MVRGQPGQRSCKNTSARLGACLPGAWGYVIPRRVHAVHMLCTCCAHTRHVLCAFCAHSVRMLCACCAHAVRMLCTCCAHAMHTLSIYAMPRLPGSGHAMRWQPRQFMGSGMQGMQGVHLSLIHI